MRLLLTLLLTTLLATHNAEAARCLWSGGPMVVSTTGTAATINGRTVPLRNLPRRMGACELDLAEAYAQQWSAEWASHRMLHPLPGGSLDLEFSEVRADFTEAVTAWDGGGLADIDPKQSKREPGVGWVKRSNQRWHNFVQTPGGKVTVMGGILASAVLSSVVYSSLQGWDPSSLANGFAPGVGG